MKRIITLTSSFFFSAVSVFAEVPSDRGLDNQPGVDLSIQGLYNIFHGLVCWASKTILLVIVAYMIWYGILFLSSRDNPAKFTSAKKNLTYGLIGIIVVFGTYTIISTVGNAVQSIGGDTGTSWVNYTPLGSCSAQ